MLPIMIASNQSRLESLREIVFDEPTRELIAARSDIRLLASVSDVIEVDAAYEKAVEAALYEKADMLILEDEESVQNAVLSIKGAGTGRTAFMPLTPHPLFPSQAVPEGILSRAIDVVKVKEGFGTVAGNLLSTILIARDIRAAFELLGDNSAVCALCVHPGRVHVAARCWSRSRRGGGTMTNLTSTHLTCLEPLGLIGPAASF